MNKTAMDDREMIGWTKWGEGRLPQNGWILVKRPGQFPKAFLIGNIPRKLDTAGVYWRLPGSIEDAAV